MDNKDDQSSGVGNFVLKRHLHDQKLRAEQSNSCIDKDEEALIDMVDERDAKAATIGQHGMTRSQEHSPLQNSASFSSSQRAQQQQESSSYFGIVISIIRGLVAPSQEIQRALWERDEASLAKLEQQNQEVYRAYVSYRSKAHDSEALLQNCISKGEVVRHTKGVEESYEQRPAEQAVQHSVQMENVQDCSHQMALLFNCSHTSRLKPFLVAKSSIRRSVKAFPPQFGTAMPRPISCETKSTA